MAGFVYEELRQLARRYMRRERPGHSLQTTAHANEAYFRLVELEPFVNMPPVASDPAHEFIRCALAVMAEIVVHPVSPHALPYFTDASVLQPALECPVLILGPGETAMAHQTDEFCYVDRIPQATAAFVSIASRWDQRV